MKIYALLLLRLSLGLLMVLWGLDKLVNVEHGLQVSEGFYFGLFTSARLLNAFGVLQVVLGILIIFGLLRRFAYPMLLVITMVTLIGVWRSILDPWGWYMEGGNVLFYPSLIIFAAALVLFAFQSEDRVSLDAKRVRKPG
jgi:uncharacterized membrane protein YphA (DoxX/SURF4 family)